MPKSSILSENPAPLFNGQDPRKLLFSAEDLIFRNSPTSEGHSLSSETSSSQERKVLLSQETKDNNLTEDSSYWNTKLMDSSSEKSTSQLKILKEVLETWITPEFSTRKKTRLSSWKRKSKSRGTIEKSLKERG